MFHRALIAAVSLGALISTARAENWPQWRGPQHDGASRETGLPIAWDETSAIAWKCELPEWGQSTPVIWDGAIFVTTQVDDRKLLLLKLDKQSGRIEWTREVADAETPRMAKGEKPTGKRGWQKFHVTHNLATPSPVTNGEVVVAHFGSGDLAAYDFSGNQLWHRNLQEEYGSYSIWWGHANSPVIAGDLVVSVCMQDTCADLGEKTFESYLVAHDLKTGAVRWKVARPTQAPAEEGDAYTTPLLWDRGPRKELVIWGAQILDAYDPATGRKLWQMGGFFGNRVVPTPLAKGNMLYIIQGKKDPLVAVEVPPAAADGESSAAVAELSREAVAWEFDQGTSDSPTPVVSGQWLFMVTNDGILRCFDTQSGEVLFKERVKGEYRASPLAAEGRIYLVNTAGLTTVIAASDKFERLAENQLDDEVFASPAVSDGRIYVRGKRFLYAIGR